MSISHFLRGKCGLKYLLPYEMDSFTCHFLRGKCGLKSGPMKSLFRSLGMSLPTREVWIEICSCKRAVRDLSPSLPTREVWIEIFALSSCTCASNKSLPTREVWIEISIFVPSCMMTTGHFLRGKCGLKSTSYLCHDAMIMSLPTREVWIEIVNLCT